MGSEIIDRSKRIPFRTMAKYGHKVPPTLTSLTSNISSTGLHLKANRVVYVPGVNLHINFDFHEKSFECEGVVVWSRRVPQGLDRSLTYGMGVRFSMLPKEFLELYEIEVSELEI